MYALNLDNSGRVLSVTYPQYASPNAMIVNTLPEGDISDYKYIDGEFVYDPLPVPNPDTTPTTDERLDALEAAMLEMIMGGA